MDAREALWLPVLPDMSGFGKGMLKDLGQLGQQGGKLFGGKFGTALKATGAFGSAGAFGKALYEIGATFDEVSDTIMVGTGATGEALDGLVQSAKNIGTTIPVDFNEAADAVATLNTATGATGDSLETLSNQVLAASKILGEDGSKNAAAYGQVLNQWSMSADEGAVALDGLFKVTQDYGIGLDGLMGQLNKYGSAMQNAGFSMEDTAVLFGKLDKSGIQVSRIMPGLNKAFRDWTAQGRDSKEALAETVEAMKNAETSQEALAIATDVFGAQGAQRMTTAVRNGSFALDDLGESLEGAEGTIKETESSTRDFGEYWQIFKNKTLAALEPVGTFIFKNLGKAMGWVAETLMPAIGSAWESWGRPAFEAFSNILTRFVVPNIQVAGDVVSQFWQNILQPAFSWISDFITGTLAPAFTGLWQDSIQPAISSAMDLVSALWGVAQPIFQAMFTFLTKTLGPAYTWLYEKAVKPAFDLAVGIIRTSWKIIRGIFDTISGVLRGSFADAWWGARNTVKAVWDGLWGAISGVWNGFIAPFLQAVGGKVDAWLVQPFRSGVDRIKSAWNTLKSAFASPINWVIDHVINNGVVSFINAITRALGLGNKLTPVSRIAEPRTRAYGAQYVRARAKGGYTPPGWTLVGEEGPELVDFRTPGRVYTANDTARMFAYGRDLSPYLTPERRYTPAEADTALSALNSGDARSLEAAQNYPTGPLLPIGGFMGNLKNWASSAWDGVTSFVADIGGKAINFVRGKLADGAAAVIGPLQNLVRRNVRGVFGDLFVGAGDRLVEWIRGVDKATEEIPTFTGEYDPAATSQLLASGLYRPVRGGRLTSRYGVGRGGYKHAGIDLAAPIGTPIYAVAGGQVIASGWNAIPGRTGIGVALRHAGGLGSYYGHMSKANVVLGQQVKPGQVIGLVGSTGRSTGPHLHWELNRGGRTFDPLPYLSGKRKSLLFDEGGILPAGITQVVNATRKPEAILTNAQWQAISALAKRGGETVAAMPDRVMLVDEHGQARAWLRVEAEKVLERADKW